MDLTANEDVYGAQILGEMRRARRFNLWMGSVLRPHIGRRVLEIGAGIGNLTEQFVPRDSYLASDVNAQYLASLRTWAAEKPYLDIRRIDATAPADFAGLEGAFDTALMVNVLEHVADPVAALGNLHRSLAKGGRAVILVPQHPALLGTLDEVLDHKMRYTPALLRQQFAAAGFRVETIFDFNRFSVPGWWLNGKVLRRKTFSRFQITLLEFLLPVVRRVDRVWPWGGLSVIGVAVKE